MERCPTSKVVDNTTFCQFHIYFSSRLLQIHFIFKISRRVFLIFFPLNFSVVNACTFSIRLASLVFYVFFQLSFYIEFYYKFDFKVLDEGYQSFKSIDRKAAIHMDLGQTSHRPLNQSGTFFSQNSFKTITNTK